MVEARAALAAQTCHAVRRGSTLPGMPADALPPPGEARSLLAVVLVVIALVVVGGGLSAAVAWRKWQQRQERARAQRECRSNLKAAFTAEKSYFAEYDRYLEDFAGVGFVPERGNHHAYLVSRHGAMDERRRAASRPPASYSIVGIDETRRRTSTVAALAALPHTFAGGVDVGVRGTCPTCEVVVACVGDLDGDPTFDVWSLATFERTLPTGEKIPPGQPHNDVDDLRE